MAKRFTDSDKFSDTWYRKLSLLHKVIWEYLLAECNHAGILENFDLEMMSFKIGAEVTLDDLKIFEGRIIFISDDVLFIPKFIEFQYGVLSESCKPHKPVIEKLKKYGLFERVSKGYQKGIDTLEEKEKDKDKEIKKENKVEKVKKLDPYINPIKSFFLEEYQKVFGNKPMLSNQDCNRLVELAADNSDIRELIPLAIARLKCINFGDIGFKPTANWLLKENNFERVINGEFGKKVPYKPQETTTSVKQTRIELTPEEAAKIAEIQKGIREKLRGISNERY